MRAPPSLAGLPVSAADQAAFMTAYAHLFEHSPWVVARTWEMRPFTDADALLAALVATLAGASPDEQLALLRAHPELADKVAMAEGLTADSAREQASAGLDRLSPEDYAAFHALNRAYRDRFGFPFIICVRLHDKEGILAAMRARVDNDPKAEMEEALRQVGQIVRLRLAAAASAG